MSRAEKGLLVNRAFSNWIKTSSTLASHFSLHYHWHCLAMADSLMSSVNNPAARVDTMFSGAVQENIEENKHIIRQIVRAIVYLAKPFRGDVEDVTLNRNPGNFLALLKSYAETDPILFQHLHHPR